MAENDDNANNNNDDMYYNSDTDEQQQRYCMIYDKTDFFTIFVQMLLACFALGSLWFKRLQEVPRRTFSTWFMDVFKQGLGACYAHVMNMVRYIHTVHYYLYFFFFSGYNHIIIFFPFLVMAQHMTRHLVCSYSFFFIHLLSLSIPFFCIVFCVRT
jgi:hypothetical protein